MCRYEATAQSATAAELRRGGRADSGTPIKRIHIIYTDRGGKCRQFSFVQRGRRLGFDKDGFVEGTDYTARTTANGRGGRIIRMKDTGNNLNNAVQLGHEAYRNGVVDSGNADETIRAVIAHTAMAANMESWGADVSLDGNNEVGYGHLAENTLYSYFKAFGAAGNSMNAGGKMNVQGGISTGFIGNTGSMSTGPHLHVWYNLFNEDNDVINENPTQYFSGMNNISYTPLSEVTSGLNINNKQLGLKEIMNIYNFTNSSNNWTNYSFNNFYNNYLNTMNNDALLISTIMYQYRTHR